MGKNESKYFYTAQLMNQALIVLLEKKDIEFITNYKDLVNEAKRVQSCSSKYYAIIFVAP